MFAEGNILNQGSFNIGVLFITTQFSAGGGIHLQNLIAGLECILLIWLFVAVGNLIIDVYEYKKEIKKDKGTTKSIGDIIKSECRAMRYKQIHLDIFTNGIHSIANKISLYWRENKDEYIIILRTNLGYLVNTSYDSFEADKEFSFICSEDEAKKNGIQTVINLFDCTLFDFKLEKEINHKGSSFICLAS